MFRSMLRRTSTAAAVLAMIVVLALSLPTMSMACACEGGDGLSPFFVMMFVAIGGLVIMLLFIGIVLWTARKHRKRTDV
ncbi:hypothetical protein [Paenibacillus koleovorans]|uniref:hypothetical protein n=1 Tax=Paenibacillus koleovorans TaxID=121608 RepID=UPI000FD8E6FF|nr:hypothetical protein [Paenibacillus koleovorans]